MKRVKMNYLKQRNFSSTLGCLDHKENSSPQGRWEGEAHACKLNAEVLGIIMC